MIFSSCMHTHTTANQIQTKDLISCRLTSFLLRIRLCNKMNFLCVILYLCVLMYYLLLILHFSFYKQLHFYFHLCHVKYIAVVLIFGNCFLNQVAFVMLSLPHAIPRLHHLLSGSCRTSWRHTPGDGWEDERCPDLTDVTLDVNLPTCSWESPVLSREILQQR